MLTTSFRGFTISYFDQLEFEVITKDIFEKQIYFFKSASANPYILDCGANIGLATLFFKTLYPNSTIIGFEPNPETFKVYQKNVIQNNLKNVTLTNAAVSDQVGQVDLYVGKKSTAWHSTNTLDQKLWDNEGDYTPITVRGVLLSNYIDQEVAMIKLDIEGAEGKVISEIKDKLNNVQNLTLEYHPNNGNSKYQIIKSLEMNHFSISSLQVNLNEEQILIKATRS